MVGSSEKYIFLLPGPVSGKCHRGQVSLVDFFADYIQPYISCYSCRPTISHIYTQSYNEGYIVIFPNILHDLTPWIPELADNSLILSTFTIKVELR